MDGIVSNITTWYVKMRSPNEGLPINQSQRTVNLCYRVSCLRKGYASILFKLSQINLVINGLDKQLVKNAHFKRFERCCPLAQYFNTIEIIMSGGLKEILSKKRSLLYLIWIWGLCHKIKRLFELNNNRFVYAIWAKKKCVKEFDKKNFAIMR